MAQATPMFRIFISSTFSDLKVERNALQEQIWPRLRELCARRGARFQAVDLRWGVSQEASLDQLTMEICLDEIARCRRVSPRPNFLVLLGDRYGSHFLPARIPVTEFEALCAHLAPEAVTSLHVDKEAQLAVQEAAYSCVSGRVGHGWNIPKGVGVSTRLTH